MPDYINEILARLSSVIARILAGLSSVERLGLTETFARLSFVEALVLVVAASQVVLLVLAILIEFSARKRRTVHELELADQQALRATRPEVVPAEEIASWPTPPPTERAPSVAPPPAEAPAEPAVEPDVEAAPAEPVTPAPPAAALPKASARIGLGLRRTRENLLARIRAAITGSAKLDEICEGLEEALIAADVGVAGEPQTGRGRARPGSRTTPAPTLSAMRSRTRSRGCSRRASAR